MTTINDIFREYAPEYIDRFGSDMPKEHLKVINAVIACRTQDAGMAYLQCEECDHLHTTYRSCGNRHCPICQHHKTRQWLENHLDNLLPGHHFMLTFTVPQNLRRFIRSHQRITYAALFKASAEAIKALALNERHIGGDLPGFFGVLHTWGRTLEYHPHIHYVVPGGAFSTNDSLWHPSGLRFFLPIKPLSILFRAKFRDEMQSAGLLTEIPSDVWEVYWNVNCQPAGDSSAVVKYLAPYVFKVAIANSRIIKVEHHTVTFRYKKTDSQRWRTMTLDAMEFIRRFLQHVLPTGFMKVRYYGFMNPNCKVALATIGAAIIRAVKIIIVKVKPQLPQRQPIVCPHCGGAMKLRAILLPTGPLLRTG